MVAWRARGSSPHTRGARQARPVRGGRPGIIPAYAGSTPSPSTRATTGRDHPRIRGEHLVTKLVRTIAPGSSPHTRGARSSSPRRPPTTGIIPAYAGSTPSPSTRATTGRDNPRIRGEHGIYFANGGSIEGSSPHTRGAPRRGDLAAARAGIIPAYAGSTVICLAVVARERDHPRIRGEHSN